MRHLRAIYGHGSYFTDVADAHDVDVLVVTDEEMTRTEASAAVAHLLPAPARRLPLDVTVVAADALRDDLFVRMVARHGALLAGDDVAADLPDVHWLEWAAVTQNLAERQRDTNPAGAALTALRAVWAGQRRVVVPKSQVPGEATGSEWAEVASAAWKQRHESAFDWPADELTRLHDAARRAAAGDAATERYERRGCSSWEHRSALLTVYRSALTADQVARLAQHATPDTRDGGWQRSAPVDDPDVALVFDKVVAVANAYWWRYPLVGMEPIGLHRHGVGAEFPAHVDRLPIYPWRAFNVVAMVQPAADGGQLFLDYGGSLIEPDLSPGDVAVFDSCALHGVTAVEAGERVVAVAHVVMEPR